MADAPLPPAPRAAADDLSGATVFVTRPLPEPGTALLETAGLQVVANTEERLLSREQLRDGLASVDAVLCSLADRIDGELLAGAPRLKVVANYAVGFDNIDVAAARGQGVEVTTTPDVLTDATADMAWALMLAAARRIGAAERLVRSGGWKGWAPTQLLGQPIGGRRLGIVGMGAIGGAVARRAAGFGMEVVYHNRRRVDPAVEADLRATYVELDELFASCDVVSLHAPLNAESRHMVDARRLSLMKPTAVLVNTGRGPLVDEAALVEALDAGRLFGAGLDVFEQEPVVHPGLLDRDDVVLAPHLGSATTTARAAMVELCTRNIVEVLAGRPAVTPAPG
jgi:glyoxylate reductase